MLATGAGASARQSIGITVFTGMIASTCLAVLFVPSFFVVVQRFEEWRKARKVVARRAAGRIAGARRRPQVRTISHNLDAGIRMVFGASSRAKIPMMRLISARFTSARINLVRPRSPSWRWPPRCAALESARAQEGLFDRIFSGSERFGGERAAQPAAGSPPIVRRRRRLPI